MLFKTFKYGSVISALVLSWGLSAQVYPVSGTVTLTPPYTPLLGEYTVAASNKIMFVHTLRDNSEPSIRVRYKLRIESSSIRLETKPEFRGSTQTIYPNVPLTVYGYDIADYFNLNNLNIYGITRQQLDKTKKLPEGQYQFCLTVLDDITGVPISQEACASAWIQLKDPPLVISPKCGDIIIPQGGPNILFQWQNQGSLSANSANSTQYELSIEEITDDNVDPLNAIPNRKTLPIFTSSPTSNMTYLYGLSDPTLDLGKRYVFRVKASDINNKDEFKNDGYSQVCYFRYGYPEGGKLTIVEPKDEHSFAKKDQRYFKWSASDKMEDAQQVKYKLTITEINQGQDAKTAMTNNTAWKEIISSPTSSKSDYDMMLQDTFPKEKKMAWKVTALSGTQVVAESDVYTFTTPPAIEQFNAGNHLVAVTKITDKDLSKFAGKGQIKIGGTDSSWVDVDFSGLKLKVVAGRHVLDGGSINTTVQMDTIGLKSKSKEVPNGVFYPEEIQLDKDALKLKGYAKIPLPLSTNSGTTPFAVTKSEWVAFDSYVLKGAIKFDDSKNTFDLLDPLGFKIKYDETSELTVSSNEFVLDLKGTLTLPKSVKNLEGKAVEFQFSEQDNFNYGLVRGIKDATILIADGTTIYYEPSEAYLDLSESESPGSHSANKEWTGIYFTKGNIGMAKTFDKSGQLVLAADKLINADLSNSYIKKSEVSGSGLDFRADLDVSHKLLLTANSYKGRVKKMVLEVEKGALKPADIEIEMIVPFVSNSKTYDVKFPLKEKGIDKGFFASKVTETVVFDPEDDQRKTEVKVSNLKFDENNQIDMTVDIKNTYTGLSLTKLQEFKVDAGGNVGFKAVGQPLALETKAKVDVGGIPLDIDSIAFGKVKGNYGIGMAGELKLGPVASGKEGELRTALVAAVSPGASGGANAKVAAEFDAETMTGSAEAGASGSAKGNVGSVVKGGASGEAGASGTIGKNKIRGDANIGAKANIESPLLNSVIGGINSISGGLYKTHSYEVELGAGAGGGVEKTKNGFFMDAYVKLDVIVAKAEGKIEYEVDKTWGAVMKGEVAVEGAFIKIKNLEGLSGQLIYGFKNNKPILLLRGGFDVAIPIVTPWIGLKNLGFAVGIHTAPETFTPDDFTPASSVDWDVNLNTPLAVYVSAGISDGVPTFGGIVYEAQMSGGGYAKGVDITNPSSYQNLSLCLTKTMQGGVFNISRGPLALIMADKSVIYLQGQMGVCYGKVLESKSRLKAKFMITPIIPLCAEGSLNFHNRMDLSKIANPQEFGNSFLYKLQFGTEANPIMVNPFCDPDLKALKGWLNVEMSKGYVYVSTGAGIDIDKRLAVPKIKVGSLGDYIAPYFEMKAKLIGKGNLKLPLSAITQPNANAQLKLNVHANLYSKLGVDYQILGKQNNVVLGKVNLLVDGTFDHQVSMTKDVVNLTGDFEAAFQLLGQTYQVKHKGTVPIKLR